MEFSADNSMTWIKFAELENLLGDVERSRAIFQIAISQTALDMPEVSDFYAKIAFFGTRMLILMLKMALKCSF